MIEEHEWRVFVEMPVIFTHRDPTLEGLREILNAWLAQVGGKLHPDWDDHQTVRLERDDYPRDLTQDDLSFVSKYLRN
jgi:hypothetical protein